MTGKLMGFPNTTVAVVQQTDGGLLYDPNGGIIYGMAVNGAALNGVRKWDAYPNGKELRARAVGDMGITVYAVSCLTYASKQLVTSAGATNSAALYGLDMMDMSNKGTFGVNSASLANSDAGRILASNYLVSYLDARGRDVVVAAPLAAASEINCIQWGKKINQRNVITEAHSVLGANPDGSGRNAWALGTNGAATTMHLYRIGPVTGGNGIQATVGALTPAQIDATWTNVSTVYGLALDQTDGNLIAAFQTTDVVANPRRLVKLRASDAAVLWSLPVNGIGYAVDRGAMRFSVIKNGKFYFMGAGGQLYIVDTIAGTADTSVVVDQGAPDVTNGTQISEDVSGSVMWYGGWTEVGLHPAYLGDYCLTQGVHVGNQMVWRFWPALGGVFSPPTYEAQAASRKRAWSFELDGHTFYVMDLGQQGTFIYDTTTGQWAQFKTEGYVAWNFANGAMWGQRIVAGDLLTTDVWEMDPGALFDNDAVEIVHVVTGGVATRNRTYHSVDSFFLACSVGQVLDQAGASVTLSFSDDQGETWTTMDTKTLPAGSFSQEIAWLSLGAFAAPGRIFKITDSGGFLRIEGADAGIDGFDTATADQEG